MATHATNTSTYKFNHTMLRVKDPAHSVAFYTEHFGLKLINKMAFDESKFALYFLAFDSASAEHQGKHWTDREGVLELTHNYGTETDPDYKVANGNEEPARGFGHVAFTVDNLGATCKGLLEKGVAFKKTPEQGTMRNMAFALDPDGYWIELIAQDMNKPEEAAAKTDVGTYRFNHTMLRVKDIEKSLQFYRSVLGMSELYKHEIPAGKFDLYFLGYRRGDERDEAGKMNTREGLLELTYNYGTETQEGFAYHNGNAEPQGFGHICVSVDDLDAACARFEDFGDNIKWKKRLTDGKMKSVAFLLDPDGYWVEIIQNEGLKKRQEW